jgi:hypothetical protein
MIQSFNADRYDPISESGSWIVAVGIEIWMAAIGIEKLRGSCLALLRPEVRSCKNVLLLAESARRLTFWRSAKTPA